MKHNTSFLGLLLLAPLALFAQNGAPQIKNLSASANWTSHTLTLQFDVEDPENDPLDIRLELSDNGGKTYSLTTQAPATGDVGFPVQPGTGRSITCDLSALNPADATFTLRLTADDKQPFDLQSLVNEVDSNRLLADLQFVEGIRHRTTGVAHLNAVRDSIRDAFLASDLYTEAHVFPYSGTTGRNILGTAPGTVTADTVIIVDAHYDTVSNAPGADDNGSGTVGVLEIARLLSRYPAKKTLRYIGFDLEEAGLVGSVRYVTSNLLAGETVKGVLNFEMIGYYTEAPNTQEMPTGFSLLFPDAYNALVADSFRGNFITNVGNLPSKALAELFAATAAVHVPQLKVITILEPSAIPVPDLRRSDHAAFWGDNRPALMLTDGANFRNECYHTPYDTFENKLNFTFMANVVKATLATAAKLAELQHGHWVKTTFAGTVGAASPWEQCAASVSGGQAERRLQVRLGDCTPHDVTVEVFNTGGLRLHLENLGNALAAGVYELNHPDLPAGVYFVKINSREGSRAFKVALP